MSSKDSFFAKKFSAPEKSQRVRTMAGTAPPLPPLPPELRTAVPARSLPDGALASMRRALDALGGGGDENDPSTSAPSLVTALQCDELRRETALWERVMYKSASQHRRAVHFQRMRGLTRHLRAIASLDVGAAAAALRDGLHAGVSERARETALSTPAVRAGAHAMWKLPPRALWEDLARRFRAVARVVADADDAALACAEALSGQTAHSYFVPFALVSVAAVARVRTSMHQLAVDVVASYNALRPLLSDGAMPPPGLGESWWDDAKAPESLKCEWVSLAGASKAVRPTVRAVDGGESSAAGVIDDEDWSWRLMHGLAEGERAERNESNAAVGTATREDLGAAVPRKVRGLEVSIDVDRRDDADDAAAGKAMDAKPSYSTVSGGLGLGVAVERKPEALEVVPASIESLASTLAPPPETIDATTGDTPGGKKRRRPGGAGGVPEASPAAEVGVKKKKKKKKQTTEPAGEGDGKPQSAVERAMALLMGK